jgi:D-3-phosphoglycerate dehydrogenase / 2-oxoglutarate reductase
MPVNKKKLLIPNTFAKVGWDIFRTRDDVETTPYDPLITTSDFHKLIPDYDGVALAQTPVGAPELAVAPRMRVVARVGVGFDRVDIPALTARGVPLMTVGIANSVTVAEHAIFMMYGLAKQAFFQDEIVRKNRWQERWDALPVDLFERTVLIIGFGRIGTRVTKRCVAMEMRVLVYDPYVPAASIKAAGCEPVADLDAALPQADIVTIHCPKSPETVYMFDAARLARMKPTAYLINTARGGIIDEKALHAALTTGKLAGAGIDVFEKEPATSENPLLALRNVIVAPHIAGVSHESVDRMAVATARNMLSVLDGTPIRENCVNPEVFGKA